MEEAAELADLRARAARLRSELAEVRGQIEAREGVRTEDGSLELLTCAAGDRAVAVPLALVEQVVLVPELLPIPDAPPWIAGLLRFRGELLTVVDVRARLEERDAEIRLSDSIVVGSLESSRFALLVQDASGVCSVARSELKALEEPADSTPYVLGLVPIQDRVGWLLSVRALTTGAPAGARP